MPLPDVRAGQALNTFLGSTLVLNCRGSVSTPVDDDFPKRLLAPGSLLDKAGVKWRVLVVSACHSGSFIDTLKDDHTLITAAAANRKEKATRRAAPMS